MRLPTSPVTRERLSPSRIGLLGLTALTDALPPRVRFGQWQRVLRLLQVRQGLPSIPRDRPVQGAVTSRSTTQPGAATTRCLLVAAELDGGGVETVVSVLGRGLPRVGVAVEVACFGGRIADELRASGVAVTVCQPEELGDVIERLRPDVVQLHRINANLMHALGRYEQVPVVPVFHAMESYLSGETWAALAALVGRSRRAVAVSGSVNDFFSARLPASAGVDIRTVVNAVPPQVVEHRPGRHASRARLGQVLGRDLAEDTVVVSLLRFSDQKNAAGLVDAFLLAAEQNPRLRLVMAGAPSNWLEVRRAMALCGSHPHGDRVHLLADSDPSVLLAAADVFALDSFAEGGPIVAVEAAAFGLPLVLSDVGFARDLIRAEGVTGRVVGRANVDFSERALRLARRRLHQSNRVAFAQALLEVADLGRRAGGHVPPAFCEAAMVQAHADVLRSAVRFASSRTAL